MKKAILFGMMALGACSLFAQKSNVNKALSATMQEGTWKSADVDAANALIAPALENPETANDAKTWYVAGMVADKEYNYEFAKSQQGKTDDNESKKGKIILSLFDYFTKADELDILPDAKGKVKPKYRSEIVPIMKFYRQPLWSYGAYSFEKNDMKSAARAFEALANMPNLPMMQGDKDMAKDSAFFAAAGENYELAVMNLARNNLTEKQDTAAYYKAVKAAYDKNPNSKLFLTSLIDYYTIMSQDTGKALELLDKAIAQEPNNVTFKLIKAQVLARSGQNDAAQSAFEQVLAMDPNNKDAVAGQAFMFLAAGDKLGEEANAITDNRLYNAKMEERKAQFAKAIPFLEKVRKLDPGDINNLQMLRQVYYNVEGESDNFKQIDAQIKALQ